MSSTALAQLSDNAVAASIAVYLLSMVAFGFATARRRSTTAVLQPAGHRELEVPGVQPESVASGLGLPDHLALNLTVVALGLHLTALTTRGLAADRAPWGNMYEFTLALSLVAAIALVVAVRATAAARDLGVWVAGLIVLALGVAIVLLHAPADELIPVLESYWLVIHVAAAITGGGIFTVGAVATVLAFLRRRRGAEAADLDRLAYGAHVLAFPIWTFAVIAGAIWAENAWGRYWGWDPKETWAFITWVFYAAYLHAQATPRWRHGRSAALALAGYTAFLFNLFGVNIWITGLHSYAGV